MAKQSILTILIQLAKRGNADREVVKGLAQIKSTMGLALGTLGAFAGGAIAVGVALNKTVTPFVNYAAQVREMSRLTGGGAEDMSRLIQAADDVKISYEGLQKALWAASKQGIDVSVESIARLADEYVAIQSPAQRAEFLAKNFGKSGAEMGKLLELGGRGVREATDAISENLVLTEQAVQQAREYEIQLDNLNDQWEAFKIGVGEKVVPALNDMMFGLNNNNAIRDEANRLLQEGIAHNREDALSMAAQNVQIQQLTAGQEANAMALHAMGEAGREAAEGIQEVVDVEAEFKTQMDELKTILGGELGPAQDEYNAKIAEYTKLLAAAKTQKEKDEINTNIAAETAAYNERAEAIMFNIQQEAILNSKLPPAAKLNMITQLGVAYGEYDQATANAITSTGAWITRVEEGTLTEEAAIQWMKDATQAMKESGKAATGTVAPLKEQQNALYHAGERALDANEKLESFKEMQAEMGSAVRHDATPAVGGLARSFGQLPADGTEWNYQFNITQSGSVPRLPSGGGFGGSGGTGGGGSVYNAGRYEQEFAGGGQPDWSGAVIVGDAPGGGMTPYTEAIINGYVFNADTTRELLKAGMLGNARRMRVGGDLFGQGVFTGGGSGGTSQVTRRRRSSGSRLGYTSTSTADSYGGGGGGGGGEIGPPSAAVTVAAAVETVAEVVEPLAGVTEAAVQAFGATQQQQISEGIQTRNTIASGNGEMTNLLRENNELLRGLQANFARAVAAAVEQVKG